MSRLQVRVIPRSKHPGVEVSESGVVIRVRSAPQRGHASEEAGKALATALGMPPSAVRLRSGARSRTKVFELLELTEDQALQRLQSTVPSKPPQQLG